MTHIRTGGGMKGTRDKKKAPKLQSNGEHKEGELSEMFF